MTTFDSIDKVKIKALLDTLDQTTTKVYIGSDSQRIIQNGKAYADYATVLVIHKNGNQGCKIFGDVTREADYDKKSNPSVRLLTEAVKAAELYEYVKDIISDFEIEIHLDLNPDEQFKSSKIVSQAVGYILGTCNIRPKVKSVAWAASYAADRYKEIKEFSRDDSLEIVN